MTWDDLRKLRRQGLRPSLPVLITTANDCWTYHHEGFAVIRHAPGQPFHVELLHGLRVVLFLGNCDRASAVIRAMNAKSVKPAELRAWCACFERLDSAPVSCATANAWEAEAA